MAEPNNKSDQTPKKSPEKVVRAKRTYSKEVMDRARKIQAARKAEENRKASEERKIRMAKRVEVKKKTEEARKKALEAKKKEEEAKKKGLEAERKAKLSAAKSSNTESTPTGSTPKKMVIDESEIVDFAVTARKYKTQLTKKFKERKFWVDPSPFEILSYIPGTVISVDVKQGRIVEEGTQILVLEAMKMQNRVDMPFTARIKKINVKPGEKIPKDFVMVELEAVDK